MSDTLVPEPQASIFDSVTKALGNDEDAARRVMLNPNLAKGFKDGKPVNKESKKDGQDICGCGNHADACGCFQPQDDDIPLKAVALLSRWHSWVSGIGRRNGQCAGVIPGYDEYTLYGNDSLGWLSACDL